MSKIGNLRFPTVFVFDPATEMVVVNTAKPEDLTEGQVGFFNAQTQVGATATPTNVTAPTIEIIQNLGDDKFGLIGTKRLSVQRVRRWRGVKAAAPADQITYIGYDEVDGDKTITVYKGQEFEINFNMFDNELIKWHGQAGAHVTFTLDQSNCNPCVADCEKLNPTEVAQAIADFINGVNNTTGFPSTLEISNYLEAELVDNGEDPDSDLFRVGVKVTGKSKTAELLDTINASSVHNTQLLTFTIAVPLNCPNVPITTTQTASAGNGWPTEVYELEKESQGYSRVRDVFDNPKYMKQHPFITRVEDGEKYDLYYLEVEVGHSDTGLPKEIVDPHIVIFACKTGQGAALQTFMNGWLTPLGFPAVTIAASTGKGGVWPQVNA